MPAHLLGIGQPGCRKRCLILLPRTQRGPLVAMSSMLIHCLAVSCSLTFSTYRLAASGHSASKGSPRW
jgi:hypothetical protein